MKNLLPMKISHGAHKILSAIVTMRNDKENDTILIRGLDLFSIPNIIKLFKRSAQFITKYCKER